RRRGRVHRVVVNQLAVVAEQDVVAVVGDGRGVGCRTVAVDGVAGNAAQDDVAAGVALNDIDAAGRLGGVGRLDPADGAAHELDPAVVAHDHVAQVGGARGGGGVVAVDGVAGETAHDHVAAGLARDAVDAADRRVGGLQEQELRRAAGAHDALEVDPGV